MVMVVEIYLSNFTKEKLKSCVLLNAGSTSSRPRRMAAGTTNTRQLRENLANYEAQLHQVLNKKLTFL